MCNLDAVWNLIASKKLKMISHQSKSPANFNTNMAHKLVYHLNVKRNLDEFHLSNDVVLLSTYFQANQIYCHRIYKMLLFL